MKYLILAAAVIFIGAATAVWAESPTPQPPAKEMILDLGNNVTMKLVLIPGGKFLMGSPETEEHRNLDELQHEVTISKPFCLGVTHVTVDQFAAFVKDSSYRTDAEKDGWSYGVVVRDGNLVVENIIGLSWRHPTFEQKGDHPVVQVSWNDAQAFCDWLSKKSGKNVRLPTEAQWEYACRAGTTTAYPWGDSPDDGKGWANCADQSLKKMVFRQTSVGVGFFSWDDGFVFTSPVGSFKANAFGLYDMNGNVMQWCADRYGDYKEGPAADPTGADLGDRRVVRGGSWSCRPRRCRSAYRLAALPDVRIDRVGIRVAVLASDSTYVEIERLHVASQLAQATYETAKAAAREAPKTAAMNRMKESSEYRQAVDNLANIERELAAGDISPDDRVKLAPDKLKAKALIRQLDDSIATQISMVGDADEATVMSDPAVIAAGKAEKAAMDQYNRAILH
ncbi:MAG: formylglycine-generating enzyme family protein [Tepidisphaeraceae bacterium]|jgi:formylglycine-generating enzyme required for sulfatase activity